ncbi:MAG: DUF1800 family protein, partial [Pseudomonadota bacterium]
GPDGNPIELFTNMDITGLARVFTGLDLRGLNRAEFPSVGDAFGEVDDLGQAFLEPMVIVETAHSTEAKDFLNCRIPAGTPAAESIDSALDCIMAHPNVGPFIGRQLIQRFTTSDPDPAYVERVAAAFDAGTYTLPDGTRVGDGRKGDLKATISAVLFDTAARSEEALADPRFGKIREPILRFTHWARAFDASAARPEYGFELIDIGAPEGLSQHPYRSRSVFNFYRPGFVAPGTQSGALGMTAPELQLVNATSTPGYMNFMAFWAFGGQSDFGIEELEAEATTLGIPIDRPALEAAFRPDYSDELELANDAPALVDHLDQVLAYGTLSAETKAAIVSTLETSSIDGPGDSGALQERVHLAVFLTMTSPDYLVQR